MTRTETLRLLLPASLPMLPPTASISSASCSAVRVVVPLSRTLRKQARDAVVRGGLGEQAGLERGDDRDERQARVFADEQAQAVRELEFLDLAGGDARRWRPRSSRGSRSGLSETTVRLRSVRYVREDAADVGGGDALDGGEVVAGEVEVAGEQPVRAEVGGASAHRGHGLELVAERALCVALSSSRVGDAAVAHFVEHPQDFGLDLRALVGIEHGVDAEEPGLPRRVAPRVDGMHEREVFAQPLVKPRTASAAEHDGGHIERGHVGMRSGGHVPREVQAREFGRRTPCATRAARAAAALPG